MKATCAPENPNIKGLLRDAVLQKDSALEDEKINVSWNFTSSFSFEKENHRIMNMNIAHLLTEYMEEDNSLEERMLQ